MKRLFKLKFPWPYEEYFDELLANKVNKDELKRKFIEEEILISQLTGVYIPIYYDFKKHYRDFVRINS